MKKKISYTYQFTQIVQSGWWENFDCFDTIRRTRQAIRQLVASRKNTQHEVVKTRIIRITTIKEIL